MKKRVLACAAVVFAAVLVGAFFRAQDFSEKLVLRLDAQLSSVDEAERRLTWESLYIQSSSTAADYERYNREALPKLLPLRDLHTLMLLEPLILQRELRSRADALLKGARILAGKAGVDLGSETSKLKSLLGKRLREFRYRVPGCELDYPSLKASIEFLERKQEPPHPVECLDLASKALLEGMNQPAPGYHDPLRSFRIAAAVEKSTELWSEDLVAKMRVVGSQVAAKKTAFEKSVEGKAIEKAFALLAGSPEAESVARDFYASLEFDLRNVIVEMHPRETLNGGGFHYAIAPPGDSHIVIPAMMWKRADFRKDYLTGLIHEFGHAAYSTSIRQSFWAYRTNPNESWYDEGLATLYILIFVEPEFLKKVPRLKISRLATFGSEKLRLKTTLGYALGDELTRAHFHMVVFRDPSQSLVDASAELLSKWPGFFFNRFQRTDVDTKRRALFYLVRELEGLVEYPLYYTGYVKGALVDAAIVERRLSEPGGFKASVQRLVRDLKNIYSIGSGRDSDAMVSLLGVNSGDTDALVSSYAKYFGVH